MELHSEQGCLVLVPQPHPSLPFSVNSPSQNLSPAEISMPFKRLHTLQSFLTRAYWLGK